VRRPRYRLGVVYPDGSFLAGLFSDCATVDEVIIERDDITVYFQGSDAPCRRQDLDPGSKIRDYLDGLPDLM
jgi:hypothetical protein